MTRVRFTKQVEIESLGVPAQSVFERDAQQRITKMTFTYQSVAVVYDITWDATSPTVTAFTQSYADV